MEDWKDRYKVRGYDDDGKPIAIDIDLYPFTKEQVDFLQEFFCCHSYTFRGDFDFSNEPEYKHRRNILNGIVLMMPKYDGERLYRCCYRFEDSNRFVKGFIFEPPHSLTTSTLEDYVKISSLPGAIYNDYTHKYIITTLPYERTKAHDFRRLRMEHLKDRIKEGQVNFEEGARFRVDEVLFIDDIKHIYMTEI